MVDGKPDGGGAGGASGAQGPYHPPAGGAAGAPHGAHAGHVHAQQHASLQGALQQQQQQQQQASPHSAVVALQHVAMHQVSILRWMFYCSCGHSETRIPLKII